MIHARVFYFFEFPLLPFQIYVKLAVPTVCARWVGPQSLRFVLGFHTFREPPGIFPQFF
jgi:hypothetical protein